MVFFLSLLYVHGIRLSIYVATLMPQAHIWKFICRNAVNQHNIRTAKVFFAAIWLCYNSIVKIEQKRKSAFFRGRFFCLEVVEISREERDVYLIPQNFVDTGTILGGTVKLRNAVEAAVLAVGSAVPLSLR